MNDAKYHTAPSPPTGRALSPMQMAKGLGAIETSADPAGHALSWSLLREDISLPTAVLYEDRLAHNLAWMQKFADEYGVKLAPHGKTTMAPKLFHRQLQSGAWGITLATATQTFVAYAHGIRRVLLANQLVGRRNLEIISGLLCDSEFEFHCLVDSAELADSLATFFRARKQRLGVLIELGVEGGRTGVRNSQQQDALLQMLSANRETLLLSGVEIYEGVLKDESSIRAFLDRAVSVTRSLAAEGRFDRSPVLLSGAGSAWYDVVAEIFSHADIAAPVEVILRPGCYLTHDAGIYREAQQQIVSRNPIAARMGSSLVQAMQLWACVQSVPEPGRAIIALGKRDAAFDAGLPLPALHYRPGAPEPLPVPASWQLTGMMDQHAYLAIAPGDDIQVGDMVAFDISHPCLTFDKWRYLPVLDAGFHVIDIVETFF